MCQCVCVCVCVGEAIWCYVCNSGEQYEGTRCESETLDKNLAVDCEDVGREDERNYTLCRKYTQDG